MGVAAWIEKSEASERKESLRRWGVHACYLFIVIVGILSVVAYDGIRREGTGAAVLRATYPTVKRSAAATQPVPLPTALKIATFNIASGQGLDGREDLSRTEQTIRQIGGTGGVPLVVVLNEVRGVVENGKSHAEILGERLDMGWVLAASERRWWREDFGNGLLLSRGLSLSALITRSPLPQTQERGWRNLVELQVELAGGKRVTILGTHIDRRVDQPAQLEFVISRFKKIAPPVILVGDMNVNAQHPAIARLLQEPGVVNATPTLEGTKPIELMLMRGLTFRSGGVVNVGASDHPLRWVEVEAGGEGSAP